MASPYRQGISPLSRDFDEIVERGLKEWNVPGLSVSVIDDLKIYSRGYGIASFPDRKVTPTTLFHTGSTTKAFTASAWALEIEKSIGTSNKVSWKTPISTIIPEDFVLTDDYATKHASLEDILSHRTGVSDHEIRIGGQQHTVKDIVRELRHIPPNEEFRTKWQYNDSMYVAASHALESRTKRWLGDILKENIWQPLGMGHTYFSLADAKASEADLAYGYVWDPENRVYKQEKLPDFPEVSGCGAIISNVVDYAEWLKMMIHQTGPLNKASHIAMLEPRSITAPIPQIPFPGHTLYSLGWFISSYRDEQIIWHSGGVQGFGAIMAFLPGRKWGFTMMANTRKSSSFVIRTLFFQLLDDLLDTSLERRVDWNARAREEQEKKLTAIRNGQERLYPNLPAIITAPSLPPEAYQGTYTNPGYQSYTFRLVRNVLHADVLERSIPFLIDLEHVNADEFLAKLCPLLGDESQIQVTRAVFTIDVSGNIESMGMELVPGEKIWFSRIRT